VVLAVLAAMVAASFAVRPDFTANFARWPVLYLFPVIGIAGAVYLRRAWTIHDNRGAFLGSATLIVGILSSVAAGLFPKLLPSHPGSPHPGLDIYNAASPANSMRIALAIYVFGMALVMLYLWNVYRVWKGKSQPYHI
jgi:cytochrome d ubiquinol oxidase subunit II